MPIIFLFNVQAEKNDKFDEFINRLRLAIVQSDDRRKFRKSKIRYFSPNQILDFEDGKNGMLILIGGLFINPGPNNEYLADLFQKMRNLTAEYFPNKDIIECMVHPYLFEKENSDSVSLDSLNN